MELIVEKPSPAQAELATPGLPTDRWLAHFGNHVLAPEIMDELDAMVRGDVRENGEIQMTASQERLRASGVTYLAYLIDGQTYDAGIPAGWIQAQHALQDSTARAQ